MWFTEWAESTAQLKNKRGRSVLEGMKSEVVTNLPQRKQSTKSVLEERFRSKELAESGVFILRPRFEVVHSCWAMKLKFEGKAEYPSVQTRPGTWCGTRCLKEDAFNFTGMYAKHQPTFQLREHEDGQKTTSVLLRKARKAGRSRCLSCIHVLYRCRCDQKDVEKL